ncbi:MAG: hypothetical protein ACYCU7_05820 [Acidimicrobiales bacterium]
MERFPARCRRPPTGPIAGSCSSPRPSPSTPTSRLSGRIRPAARAALSRRGRAPGLTGVGLFYLLAIGKPAIGTVSASLPSNFGGTVGLEELALANHRAVFSGSGPASPPVRSFFSAVITAARIVGPVTAGREGDPGAPMGNGSRLRWSPGRASGRSGRASG